MKNTLPGSALAASGYHQFADQGRTGIGELAELPATHASFWFTYAELQEKSPEEPGGINDWKKNSMAALPAWMALVSKKA